MSRSFGLLSKFRTMSSTAKHNIEGEITRSFLQLENIDPNIFRAPKQYLWHPTMSRFIFGGQVVGQALGAACNTVSPDHHVHSLHCYFLRGGNSNWPILYHVDRTRDGETYSSRSVKASQDGKAIFTMQASFKTDETSNYSYQWTMPDVKHPDNYRDTQELLKIRLGESISDMEKDYINRTLADEVPLCIRPIDPEAFYRRKKGDSSRLLWMKFQGKLGDDLKIHQCVAAYMSDFSLLGTSLQPGGPDLRITFMTSLDHTIWFHNPFRVDDWLLYEATSPQCGNGRAFSLGRIWKPDGTLVISVAQEGVVRTEDPKKSKL